MCPFGFLPLSTTEASTAHADFTRDMHLFVDPWLAVVSVLANTLSDPKADLMVCRLYSIGAVDDVAAYIDAEVASDSTRLRLKMACCSVLPACSCALLSNLAAPSAPNTASGGSDWRKTCIIKAMSKLT